MVSAEYRAWHSVDTDILVEATVVGWRMRDVGNDVSLPTRDGGGRRYMNSFKKPDLVERTRQEGGSRAISQERR
jgi:hypothetical protein